MVNKLARKRSRHFIKKTFQMKIIFQFIIILIIGGIISGAELYFLASNELETK